VLGLPRRKVLVLRASVVRKANAEKGDNKGQKVKSAQKKTWGSQVPWLTPVILATWEAETGRIVVKMSLDPISMEKAGYGGTHLSSWLLWEV
jgi:hypothetical protein